MITPVAPPPPVPRLAHLRDFTRARSLGHKTHVARDREELAHPVQFQAFCYEKLITAVIEYVNHGCAGGALDRAVEHASERMHESYAAVAQGVARTLAATPARAALRRQRNIVVPDGTDIELVSLRVHLMMRMVDGRFLGTFIYFSAARLAAPELRIVETAVTLALRSVDPAATPAIWFARSGHLHVVDAAEATTPARVSFLRTESKAYCHEWAFGA